MKLYHISLNSLWRRKTRMVFLFIGLIIAVSTVIILLNISQAMNADIVKKLDEYGANILVTPKTDDLSLSYGGMAVSGVSFDLKQLSNSDVENILTIKNKKNIKIIAPKLLNIGQVQSKKVLVVGVNFEQEIALKKWWTIIGRSPTKPDEAMIGADVKRKLSLGLNQAILINGQPFKIVGVLEETGSQDDGLIFIDLAESQRLFNKPALISLIEVAALCYDCPIEEIVAQTSDKLPNAKVMAIQKTINSKMETIQQFQNFSIGISIVIMLVGALIAFTTISASVSERKMEIGIFRSIGFRQRHIMKIILLEAFLISGLAGLFGYVMGLFIASRTAPLLGAQSAIVFFNGKIFLFSMVLSIIVGISAAIYPAFKASRLDPTVALRAL